MLATRAVLPDPPRGWSFEVKWDGVRVLATVADGCVRLRSRNGNDVTGRYPELADLGGFLEGRAVVLDGEVVAVDAAGRPDFQMLQRRMHVQSSTVQRRLAQEVPVTYLLFDLLWLDGSSTLGLPYERRRALLEGLALDGPSWRTPAVSWGDPGPVLAFARAHGLEGVVAKRSDGRYEPGRRSRSWIKAPFELRQEFVVGGWLPGEGARTGRIGALLLGVVTDDEDDRSGLRFAGRVGAGFRDEDLAVLSALLEPLATGRSPFAPSATVPVTARFVRPALVVEVRFAGWTAGGIVRHPTYLGLRDDRRPGTVVRET
ncbi:MAG: non-homologous end-joining DNA ligase [Acidimicrobiales bacterium]|jgi:bifunctional non-homologous end joining protein LigD|nr:non-homologous end-joining DNA ligase [Acidimicrobiales bacterium]